MAVPLTAFAAGAVVAVLLGVVGKVHDPTLDGTTTLGFRTVIDMKVVLTVVIAILAVLQVVGALWLYGKLGVRPPSWLGTAHRISGTVALLLAAFVGYHCLWALGLETGRFHDGTKVPVRTVAHGVEAFVARDDVASVLAGPVAGVWALEALRIADGRPRLGLETDHRTIPHELGWLETAVHLDKGCYRGQETVARVHNLGRPPRRLVLLHLDGSESVLPEHGEPVLLGDRSVGSVTSAARHYELGPIALALVKRSTPAEETLVTAGIAAAQEVLVPA